MNAIAAQDIKKRGISAVDEALKEGPVHVIKNNQPKYVVLSEERYRDLEKDPFQPHLDYHHLGGKQTGVQAVSITDSYRITMTVIITKKEIILLDIGSHDEVY